jgi:hypothetical protein
MDDDLAATIEALHWIKVSLLQAERFVGSFLDFAESDDPDGTELNADGHFLLNAAAQAEKALKRVGRPIAGGRTTTIRALRDVHEHWEQHKTTFESKHAPKTRAGLRFSEAHPDHLPWAFRIDATGTFISALRLEDLWDELVGLEGGLTTRALALGEAQGIPIPQPPNRGPLPRRDSKVLAMAVVMQNIVLDFDET